MALAFGGGGECYTPATTAESFNQQFLIVLRSEWPSGPASSISLTEVKHGCVWSETGWVTFQMKDQNSSLRRPLEGTLN